ncbi:MAG: PSD1 domain-containing protein [Verrucomicrobia bacterium]|nr:PSD1 domain-containing protein [Verrucomicrobiota bacterium]
MKKIIISLLAAALAPAAFAAAIKLDAEQQAYFEKKIRPVLVEQCYKCHSTQPEAKIKGGLNLETRETTLKGGDSGPAIVPGKPDKSALLKAMKHVDPDLAMPPKEPKLADNIIADFEEWIRMGAADPREATGRTVSKVDYEKAKEHWAFKAVTKQTPPKVADKNNFVQSPIDSFVLAKLTEKNLAPSAKADKRTLIRRVTYDLTGLPPTPEEVDAFVKDNSKDAYAKLVDRLLNSPHYGEHWGRLWLDVARYADTTGDRQGGGRRNPLMPYAWTYRDYVIDSFNKDVPYDQFIVQQIAADRLPESAQDKSLLRALGFMTIGKTFMGNENEVIDDRIDVISKGLMGFTVSCARCHDHKFDPVSQKEYYGLHGVFASSRPPGQFPLLAEPKKTPEYEDFLAKIAEVEKQVEAYHEAEYSRVRGGMLDKAGDYLFAVQDAISTGAAKGGNPRNVARKYKLEGAIFELWLDTVRANSKGKPHPLLAPWVAYAAIPEKEFAKQAKAVTASLGKDQPANATLVKEFRRKTPASLKDVAAVYTRVISDLQKAVGAKAFVYNKGGRSRDAKPVGDTKLADAGLEELRVAFFDDDKACVTVGDREMRKLLGNQFTTAENAIRNTRYSLEMSHPGSPARAMILEDSSRPRDSAVLIRGEPKNPGPIAPRQFIQILSKTSPTPFKDGSGRLELARAIASRDNPLTPRVWANRVWKNLFGEAIVRTPSDFGVRSDSPTHPEMLDWLAGYLMDNGWSTKKLVRAVVLSSTYQQDSRGNEKAMVVDPTNQLLWRQNIRRLPFEAIRDTFLMVGGTLDLNMGGQPIRLDAESRGGARQGGYNYGSVDLKIAPRRTVYGYIDRSALPEVYRTFDFANPDMSTGERILTTVPQQALFMMNSPFVADTVRHLLDRPEFHALKTPEEKVKFLYRSTYQRPPSEKEMQLSLDYLARHMNEEQPPIVGEPVGKYDSEKLKAMSKTERKAALSKMQGSGKNSAKALDTWERYTQVVLLANEFIFLN